jgi:cytochrome c2
MNNKRYVLIVFAAIVLFIYPLTVHAGQKKQNACVTCHEFLGGALAKPVLGWKGSIHQENAVTCDYCHGGNAGVSLGDLQQLSQQQFAAKQALAMSKSSGFIGIPVGKSMFDACRKCHRESVDRYANSIMGKVYLDNKGGPSCVTCHNAHRNIIPNVPKVCESCHKDTSGFDRIDPMNVTAVTVNTLSKIRIKLAERKARGDSPSLLPEFPEELGAFQIGFVAFGAVFVLFIIGYIIYIILEKRR